MLYLELGCLPIKFIIASRRLSFLHYRLKEVFDAQRKKPLKDNWCTTVMEDLEDLKLNLNFDEIKKMSENQFK